MSKLDHVIHEAELALQWALARGQVTTAEWRRRRTELGVMQLAEATIQRLREAPR